MSHKLICKRKVRWMMRESEKLVVFFLSLIAKGILENFEK